MSDIKRMVVKDGKVIESAYGESNRSYAGVAVVATLVAAGLGGYILGQSSRESAPESAAVQGVSAAAPVVAASNPTVAGRVELAPAAVGASGGLEAAVADSVKDFAPSAASEKKFVEAQRDYLRQPQESAEQLKARLDKLATDKAALEEHNRLVLNRVKVVANDQNARGADIERAVAASTEVAAVVKDKAGDVLRTEAQAREAAGRTYEVKPGDTLWVIAQKVYGDPYHYKRIFEANPRVLVTPDHIFPGQVLRVPV